MTRMSDKVIARFHDVSFTLWHANLPSRYRRFHANQVTLPMEMCQQFSWSSAKMFVFSRRRKTSWWQPWKIHQRPFLENAARNKREWTLSYLYKNRGQWRVEMIEKELNFLRFKWKSFRFDPWISQFKNREIRSSREEGITRETVDEDGSRMFEAVGTSLF